MCQLVWHKKSCHVTYRASRFSIPKDHSSARLGFNIIKYWKRISLVCRSLWFKSSLILPSANFNLQLLRCLGSNVLHTWPPLSPTVWKFSKLHHIKQIVFFFLPPKNLPVHTPNTTSIFQLIPVNGSRVHRSQTNTQTNKQDTSQIIIWFLKYSTFRKYSHSSTFITLFCFIAWN